MKNALMMSGIGQSHTDEPGKDHRKPYLTIGWDDIRAMVDNPQQCDKARAQWLIPSTLLSRTFKTQEQQGEFWMLWSDFDDDKDNPSYRPLTLHDLAAQVETIIGFRMGNETITGDTDYELYNSRSATVDMQKSRLLVPLLEPLSGADWMLAQEVLNDKLEALGIKPDRATQRAAQLCYLPNRGEFYESISKRFDRWLDPLYSWQAEIRIKRDELAAQQKETERAKASAKARRETLKPCSGVSSFERLVKTFNNAYTPMEWMTSAGYDQRGNTFRHPNSQKGSFSASVKADSFGVLRVHTFSSSDPLHSAGQGAHDAFSTFCTLFHGGDNKAAAIEAGNKLLTIGCVSYNDFVQREHMQNKAAQKSTVNTDDFLNKQRDNSHQQESATEGDMGHNSEADQDDEKPKEPFTLARFSISGKSSEMRKQMLGTKYVIDRLVIRGQSTVIYAKYNTGKTLLVLWGLAQSIEKGIVEGNDIYYINADDDFDGLTTKTEIAEQYGFHMLTPGFEGFVPSSMQGYLRQMITDGTAEKSVLILDTLKKFTDQMDKKGSSAFMNRVGEFITAKGTVLMLSHVNKSRDEHGKVVHCGTSDVPDDASCVFTLDEVSTSQGTKQVLFENIKNRGLVAKELAFSYSIEEGQTYRQIFDSVKVETAASSFQAKTALDESIKAARDKLVIDSIIETLKAGIVKKTELIKAVQEDTGISKPRITSVLNNYCGKRWQVIVGDRNAKTYSILTMNQSTENEYRRYKDGE